MNTIFERFAALFVLERLVIVVFHGFDPSGRCGNFVEVEEMRVKDLVEIDVAIVAFESLSLFNS